MRNSGCIGKWKSGGSSGELAAVGAELGIIIDAHGGDTIQHGGVLGANEPRSHQFEAAR